MAEAEQYQILIESFAEAVWEVDASGRAVVDSPGWRAFTGQSQEAYFRQGWTEVVHPDERDAIRQQWQHAIHYQTPFRADLSLQVASGDWRWTTVRAVPVINSEGSLSKWLAMAIDINEHRQTQESYRTFIDSIDEGYFVADVIFNEQDEAVDIAYLSANPAAIRMTGSDFTGRRLREIDAGYEPYWYQLFGRVAQTGQAERLERYADPDKKWYNFYVFRIGNENSRRIGVVFQDITERKRREAIVAFLAEIDDDFSRLSSTDQIMQSIGVRMGQAMNVATCHFIDVDESREKELTVSYFWGQPGVPVLLGKFRIQDYLNEAFGRACRAGETVVINDTQTDSRTNADAYRRLSIGAFVGVPFFRDGKWKYVLSITNTQARDWHAHEIEFFREVGSHIFRQLERERAIEAVRKSEERFRTLVQNLPDYAIFRIDTNGLITEWTEGAQRVKGYTPEEAIGRHVSLFYTPEGLAAGEWENELAEAKQTGRAERESERIRKSGERFWVNEIATAIYNADGLLIGFTKISRDITRRKKAQAIRRTLEQRSQIAIEAANLATWEWHLATDNVYWNEKHFSMLGMQSRLEPVSSSDFLNHVHPDDRERIKAALTDTIERRVPYDAELRVIRNDGETRWMSGYGQVTDEKDGKPTRLNGVMFDITDRKRAEASIRLADQRKDEFIAMLSHELRNPLAPIRNGLHILQLTSGNDEIVQSSLAMMSRQVDHLVRLVDDLLDLSRLSRGKIELHRQRMELGALVIQAIETTRPLYEERGRRLHVKLPASTIYLNGDATRLTQVVTNLLTNGVRYTGVDGQVWISLEQVGGTAILRVSDNGIGLADDQLTAVFELFVQVDNSLARSQGGLGLGLTLVKQLVEMHGGRVEACSAGLGRGSEFVVYLPLPEEPTKLMERSVQISTARQIGSRVLLVDDNQDAAMTLARLLMLKGHEVHTFYSGREAVAAFGTLKPEVILLDIGMPDLDGYQTCRLIREQPDGNDVVILAITGYGQEEDKRRTRGAGFNDHLVKPVDLTALLNLFTTLLPARNAHSE